MIGNEDGGGGGETRTGSLTRNCEGHTVLVWQGKRGLYEYHTVGHKLQ